MCLVGIDTIFRITERTPPDHERQAEVFEEGRSESSSQEDTETATAGHRQRIHSDSGAARTVTLPRGRAPAHVSQQHI